MVSSRADQLLLHSFQQAFTGVFCHIFFSPKKKKMHLFKSNLTHSTLVAIPHLHPANTHISLDVVLKTGQKVRHTTAKQNIRKDPFIQSIYTPI